ncbi:hypothetical protein [Nostoc linckia]|uniref:hypothetical protein n=1 Tax=Nostoc linckia TaxID=92942 RepID=UPI00117D077E|nr:hypothetical protein [Nostoc linckia]
MSNNHDNQQEPEVRIVGLFCPHCGSVNTCFYWDERNQTYSYKCRSCGYFFSRSSSDDEFF